jgi:hypothetical protein
MTPEIISKLIQLRRIDGSEQLFLHVQVNFPITKFTKSGENVVPLTQDATTREVTLYIAEDTSMPRLETLIPISYLIHLGQVTPTNPANLPLELTVKDAAGTVYGSTRLAIGGVLQQDEPDNNGKPIKWV